MSNTIKKDDPRLTAFVLGELSPADAEHVQNAISNSSELAGAVEEIRMAIDLLGTAYQTESPLRLLDQQKTELARVASHQSGDRLDGDDSSASGNRVSAVPANSVGSSESKMAVDSKASSKSRPWLPIVLAASLIGLLVGGALYLNQSPPSSSVASKMDAMEKLSDSSLEQLKKEVDFKGNQPVVDSGSDRALDEMQETVNAIETAKKSKEEGFWSSMAASEDSVQASQGLVGGGISNGVAQSYGGGVRSDDQFHSLFNPPPTPEVEIPSAEDFERKVEASLEVFSNGFG